MPVRINQKLCNSCGNASIPKCAEVCPGDLLFKDSCTSKCRIRDQRDCWDCAACIKECPRQAIEMYLPVELGGRGATLKTLKSNKKLIWVLSKPDGKQETITI